MKIIKLGHGTSKLLKKGRKFVKKKKTTQLQQKTGSERGYVTRTSESKYKITWYHEKCEQAKLVI